MIAIIAAAASFTSGIQHHAVAVGDELAALAATAAIAQVHMRLAQFYTDQIAAIILG